MTKHFGEEVSKLSPYLMQRAIGLTAHHRSGAEDLVQETICKALANESQFVAGTNMRAWLRTILQNLFYEKYRRSKRVVLTGDLTHHQGYGGKECIETVFAEKIFGGTEATQEDDPYREQMRARVQRALACLPKKQEIILRIWMRSGGGYGDIVRLLEIPRGTAKSRVHRAQYSLRQILIALDSGEPIPQFKNPPRAQ